MLAVAITLTAAVAVVGGAVALPMVAVLAQEPVAPAMLVASPTAQRLRVEIRVTEKSRLFGSEWRVAGGIHAEPTRDSIKSNHVGREGPGGSSLANHSK